MASRHSQFVYDVLEVIYGGVALPLAFILSVPVSDQFFELVTSEHHVALKFRIGFQIGVREDGLYAIVVGRIAEVKRIQMGHRAPLEVLNEALKSVSLKHLCPFHRFPILLGKGFLYRCDKCHTCKSPFTTSFQFLQKCPAMAIRSRIIGGVQMKYEHMLIIDEYDHTVTHTCSSRERSR